MFYAIKVNAIKIREKVTKGKAVFQGKNEHQLSLRKLFKDLRKYVCINATVYLHTIICSCLSIVWYKYLRNRKQLYCILVHIYICLGLNKQIHYLLSYLVPYLLC